MYGTPTRTARRQTSNISGRREPIIGTHSPPNNAAQAQPPGSHAPTKPMSIESPATAENERDGGFWLERAGSAERSLGLAPSVENCVKSARLFLPHTQELFVAPL